MLKKVAILVDGDFFIRCHKAYFKKLKKGENYEHNPEELAKSLHKHCLKHIDKNKEKELLSGKITIGNIINDYIYYAKQKGIDMKIGIDSDTNFKKTSLN